MRKLLVFTAVLCLLTAAFAHAATPALKKLVTGTPVKSTVAGDSVTYIWDANDPAQKVSGYRFYEHTAGGYNLLGTVTDPSYTVASISAGTHAYVATAYRDSDSSESAYSNEVTETVTAPLPPLTPPTNLKKVATGLTNISARANVGTGDNVLIGGFIVSGETTNVIVRATAPTLVNYGIANPLFDPTLELHDSTGAVIATNDNWQDTQASDLQASGLAPKDYRESAIVTSLEPGNYTAILRGKNNTQGIALVEIYHG